MAKRSKRYKKNSGAVEIGKVYDLKKASEILVQCGNAKFDETVEVALTLGIDAKKSDQGIRGSAPLPHGLGKKVRVAVFAKGEKAQEAEKAGADIVGADDLAEKIKGGFFEFDCVIATPDMMGQVGKVGKLLGPRGLMPSPKVGTVTFDLADAIKAVKAGRAEFRSEKAGVVHAPVGKVSFGPDKISENVAAFLQTVARLKPSSSKGVFLQAASISSTMGPGVAIDLAPFRAA